MTKSGQPHFSIVMTVYNDGLELEQNLPSFLGQEYDGDFEVIVVDESSTDNTDDVLTLLKASHPNLYSTFLPKPDRSVVRKRLALTLGVKAAKHDWIIFSSIHNAPPSPQWLQEISEYASDSANALFLGYVRKKDGALRLQLFDNVEEAANIVSKAERSNASADDVKRLRYVRGYYDFLAVRKEHGHEALCFYEHRIRGMNLLALRAKVFFHNLFH